jgi:hypothetical protein
MIAGAIIFYADLLFSDKLVRKTCPGAPRSWILKPGVSSVGRSAKKKQAGSVSADPQPVSPHRESRASVQDLGTAYQQLVEHDPEHLCPRCGRPRGVQGAPDRWGLWSQQHRDRITLGQVRCRACGTVEPLVPPWLRPHEELTLDALNPVLEVVVDVGRPGSQGAVEWGLEPVAIRRRIRRGLPHAAELRQRGAQQATPWGIPLAGPTWTPPTGSRSADWSWLLVAWMALFVILGGASTFSVGLPQWREWVPEHLPAPVVPPGSHRGRRLRGLPPRPP